MAVCYKIVYTPDDAEFWLSYEDREDLNLKTEKIYKIHIEGEGGLKKYCIFNDKKEKIYNVWEKARGDFIEY